MTRKSGALARDHGERAESAVRFSLELLERQGACAAEWTYPKSRIVKNGGKTFIVYSGGGVPDVSAVFRVKEFNVTIPAWFDVKTTGRKNKVTLSSGAAQQYIAMRRVCDVGGLGFFLVLWRYEHQDPGKRVDEWRIHPVYTKAAEFNDLAQRVTLSRKDGKLVYPIGQTKLPSPGRFVWDSQVYLPDLYRAIKDSIS